MTPRLSEQCNSVLHHWTPSGTKCAQQKSTLIWSLGKCLQESSKLAHVEKGYARSRILILAPKYKETRQLDLIWLLYLEMKCILPSTLLNILKTMPRAILL